MSNLTKIPVSLVKPEGVAREREDGSIEAVTTNYKKLMDTEVELTLQREDQKIALEWALKLLKSLNMRVIITEHNFKELSNRSYSQIINENTDSKR